MTLFSLGAVLNTLLFFRPIMRMTRFPKGSDVVFLNNQEDQVDPDSILTTYKSTIQHKVLEINHFSWSIIAVQHLDALRISDKYNSSFSVFFLFSFFYYFQLYTYADHSHLHVSTLNNSTKDESSFVLLYFIPIQVFPLLSIWVSCQFLYWILSGYFYSAYQWLIKIVCPLLLF